MKMPLLAVVLAGVFPIDGWGQTTNAPPDPVPPTSGAVTTSTDASTPSSDGASTALEYLFNHKPGDGTAAQAASDLAGDFSDKVKAIDALRVPGLDDPTTRAGFITFLGLPEVSADRIKLYSAKLAQVSDLLKQGQTWDALNALDDLRAYPDIDPGLGRELANRVETIRDARQTVFELGATNDRLRQLLETYDWNADTIANSLREKARKEKEKDPVYEESVVGNDTAQASPSFDLPSLRSATPSLPDLGGGRPPQS